MNKTKLWSKINAKQGYFLQLSVCVTNSLSLKMIHIPKTESRNSLQQTEGPAFRGLIEFKEREREIYCCFKVSMDFNKLQSCLLFPTKNIHPFSKPLILFCTVGKKNMLNRKWFYLKDANPTQTGAASLAASSAPVQACLSWCQV